MTHDFTPGEVGHRQSVFSIPKMDCPSEENLVRMALGDVVAVQALSFDLAKRELKVVHRGNPDAVLQKLQPLKLGAVLQESSSVPTAEHASAATEQYTESVFSISKMDCPSEENLIRMAVNDLSGVQSLSFDLSKREVKVVHQGMPDTLLERLRPLQLDASLIRSAPIDSVADLVGPDHDTSADETRTLRLLLGINGLMFFVELVLGLVAQSTGLIADSLDMFADAAVYGLSLYAVGKAASMKLRAAHLAGWLQLLLALGALSEVVRRFLFGSEPESGMMMAIGLLALAANVTCLVLISRKRDYGAHMRASYIFSANDVLANLGVITAGALVAWTGSPYPDLVIGTVIGAVVLNGARRILQLR